LELAPFTFKFQFFWLKISFLAPTTTTGMSHPTSSIIMLTMLCSNNNKSLLELYIRSVMTEEDMQALSKEFLAPREDVAGGYDPEALLSDDEAEYISTHVATAVEEEEHRNEYEFHHEWA
jgi:hypothetical protein